MNKILAVALLDWKRLAFGLVSAALVAGLIPSLASGLGAPVEVATVVGVTLMLVGAAAGACFGSDFFAGRSSFYFARPLPSGVLLAGRFAALLALEGAAFLSFMASSWISTSGRSSWTPAVLTPFHIEATLTAWSISLFVTLAVAVHARGVREDGGMKAMVMIALRLGVLMGAFVLVFGLFADLVLRAFSFDPRPIRVFFLSWVAASLVASCAAIAAGRTERLRISRFQGRVMAAHFVLVSVVVVAAWSYVLHPGPDAIVSTDWGTFGSPDGRLAFVRAKVDRGGKTLRPTFILDLASGQAKLLNVDPGQGPWLSADGAIMVWSEATPIFFRPLWRRMGGGTTFRVKTASGDVMPLAMPRGFSDYRSVRDLTDIGDEVNWVLPSPDGDVFAVQWGSHLTFMSRSHGEMADLDVRKALQSRNIFEYEAVFLPSGQLRAAAVQRGAGAAQTISFVDIDPRTASTNVVAAIPVDGAVRIAIEPSGAHAVLTSLTQPGRGAWVELVDLAGRPGDLRPTVVLRDVMFPFAAFLADGRIVIATGGSAAAWQKRTIQVLSPVGRLLLDIPIGDGMDVRLGREIFPGVLSVATNFFNTEMSLFDTTTGAVLRRIPDMFTVSWLLRSPAVPGSPAARLLQSRDGKLYDLPSLNAEPRLLLPLPR